MKIDITDEHIRNGKKGDWETCPIGLALSESTVTSPLGFAIDEVNLNRCLQFAEDFDKDKAIKPFSFEVVAMNAEQYFASKGHPALQDRFVQSKKR